MQVFAGWISAIAALLLSCGSVLGQDVRRVKTGDKLAYENLRYEQKGKEIQATATTTTTADVVVSSDGKTISYSNGRVDRLDSLNTLVERAAGGVVQKFEGNRALRVLPENGDYTKSYRTGNGYDTRECGAVEAAYEATSKPVSFRLRIDGQERDVAAHEIFLDGQWKSPRCGTGRQTQKLVYSRDLDIILDVEFMNYRPNGDLFIGNRSMLRSVN